MDSRTTSLVHHRTSLPFMSSLDKDTRISMHSNEVTMIAINIPTVNLAANCHRAPILRPGVMASQISPQTTGCHRKHIQLEVHSLTIEDIQMSVSVLSRLLKRTCHMHNLNHLHNRLVRQWSSLHVLSCPSRNLNQKPPWTLMSTIRKSHGVQDLQESVHWPIEYRKLLPHRSLNQLPSLNLWSHKRRGVQIIHLHKCRINPPHVNLSQSQRLSSTHHNLSLVLHINRHHECSALPRSSRDLVLSRRLKTLPGRMLSL